MSLVVWSSVGFYLSNQLDEVFAIFELGYPLHIIPPLPFVSFDETALSAMFLFEFM